MLFSFIFLCCYPWMYKKKKIPENDLYRYSVLFWSSFKVKQECVEDRTFLRNDGYIERIPVLF